TAGGRSAAATATPATPSGIPFDRASMVANPRRTAITTKTGFAFSRDAISEVTVIWVTNERKKVVTKEIEMIIKRSATRILTQFSTFLELPTAVFTAKA